MDITRKGWKCDCCNKEYYEGDWGYKAKYTVTIECQAGFSTGKADTYDDICDNCIDSILEILEPADID